MVGVAVDRTDTRGQKMSNVFNGGRLYNVEQK